MTIGIPKSLFYWKRPHFWETLFENLDFQVRLSPSTNKEIAETGVKVSDPETCFAEKIFFGHLLWLDQKCDWIFIPRLKANEEKLEYCPKFFALPDLAKILVKTPILTATFDPRKEKTEKTFERLRKKINKNKKEMKKAIKAAFLEENELREKKEQHFFKAIQSEQPKIVLISHPYNLYDDYVNLRIKEKLEELGVEPIFINEVSVAHFNDRYDIVKDSGYPKFHWEFGKEIMEQIDTVLSCDTCPVNPALFSKNNKIAGAIELSSFQCGCDAVLKEFVEKKFKSRKIPFLYLIVDEHTAEAGVQTRLEAFVDTLGSV